MSAPCRTATQRRALTRRPSLTVGHVCHSLQATRRGNDRDRGIEAQALPKAKSSRVTVQENRNRLRAWGLRPVQIWVPDVHARAFRSQAHRQSLAVAQSAHAHGDQAFIDAVSDRGCELNAGTRHGDIHSVRAATGCFSKRGSD